MSTREEDISSSDFLLIKEIANGSREAFRTLYGRYVRRVFSYSFKITRNSKIAEEITNDVMFEVWRGAKSFKGKSSLLTWILGIAHNKAINEIRKRSPELLESEEFSRFANSGEGVEEKMLEKDRAERIKMALDNLSVEHRTVLELTFYQGLSYQEIAGIMNCPVNTVKTRMFYAKEKLKETLIKLGITEEAI
jgi:RNA polymerase sigma-70 factor (ECF subfamily)